MALIFCPECGTQVSEHAQQCVKCAYPIISRKNNSISIEQNKTFDEATNSQNIHISDFPVWIVAFFPLLSDFIQGFVYGFVCGYKNEIYDYNKFYIVPVIFIINVLYFDFKQLKKAEIDTDGLIIWMVIFFPVYLYKRAERLNQNQSYFWVWLVTFFISIYLYIK